MTDPQDRVVPIDHLLKQAEQNKLSPTEALQLDRVLQAEAKPEGVFAPITLAHPTDVAPIAYVLHKWTSRCLACNSVHTWSETYALNHLKSRTGSAFVRNMVPITKLDWNVPLRVHEPKQRETPFCHDCIDATTDYLATLPSVPVPQAVVKLTAVDTSTTRLEAKAKPKSGKITSVDDLLD